jgi:hypothetical protein
MRETLLWFARHDTCLENWFLTASGHGVSSADNVPDAWRSSFGGERPEDDNILCMISLSLSLSLSLLLASSRSHHIYHKYI